MILNILKQSFCHQTRNMGLIYTTEICWLSRFPLVAGHAIISKVDFFIFTLNGFQLTYYSPHLLNIVFCVCNNKNKLTHSGIVKIKKTQRCLWWHIAKTGPAATGKLKNRPKISIKSKNLAEKKHTCKHFITSAHIEFMLSILFVVFFFNVNIVILL